MRRPRHAHRRPGAPRGTREDRPAPRPASQRGAHWRHVSLVAFAACFAGLALRQHLFVDRHAVNMLFWDQWDFYLPLFREGGLWDCFEFQQGSHRMGIAFLFTKLLAHLGSWNVRWDAFAVSFTMMVACVLSLRLAVLGGLRVGLGLAALPLAFLNLRQYEGFVGASNLSHGAAPVLLLLLVCLCYFWRRDGARLAALATLHFLLIFTGYGIFAGLVLPPMLLAESVQAWRRRDRLHALGAGLATVSTLVSWAVFSIGYTYVAHLEGLDLKAASPHEYLLFIGCMQGNFFGLHGGGAVVVALGLLVFLLQGAVCVYQGLRFLRQGPTGDRLGTCLLFLSAFTVVYMINTALGRAAFGYETHSQASRYIPLMVPGIVALVLQAGRLPSPLLRHGLPLGFAAALAAGTLALRPADLESVAWYENGRRNWREVFLASRSETKANEDAGFKIFPHQVHDRLRYLERHKLNLFTPAAGKAEPAGAPAHNEP